MRGEGRQAVFAHGNQYLFTLYTHQPDHEHTRDLLAARAGKPDVHAFVHSLNTMIGFATASTCRPRSGTASAQSHAIAIAPANEVPYVVDVSTGTVAELDPDQLTVKAVKVAFAGVKEPASAAVSRRGDVLFVAAGSTVSLTRWAWPRPARGSCPSPPGGWCPAGGRTGSGSVSRTP